MLQATAAGGGPTELAANFADGWTVAATLAAPVNISADMADAWAIDANLDPVYPVSLVADDDDLFNEFASVSGWTAGFTVDTINARSGSIHWGTIEATAVPPAELRAEFDVAAYATDIDGGRVFIDGTFWQREKDASGDTVEVVITFLDGGGSTISTSGLAAGSVGTTWTQRTVPAVYLPANTRTVRYAFIADDGNADGDVNTHIDDALISLGYSIGTGGELAADWAHQWPMVATLDCAEARADSLGDTQILIY